LINNLTVGTVALPVCDKAFMIKLPMRLVTQIRHTVSTATACGADPRAAGIIGPR